MSVAALFIGGYDFDGGCCCGTVTVAASYVNGVGDFVFVCLNCWDSCIVVHSLKERAEFTSTDLIALPTDQPVFPTDDWG